MTDDERDEFIIDLQRAVDWLAVNIGALSAHVLALEHYLRERPWFDAAHLDKIREDVTLRLVGDQQQQAPELALKQAVALLERFRTGGSTN